MPSSFAVDFLCGLGEVAAVQIFEWECGTQGFNFYLLWLFESHLRMRLKVPRDVCVMKNVQSVPFPTNVALMSWHWDCIDMG